jgi:hypothetical protein
MAFQINSQRTNLIKTDKKTSSEVELHSKEKCNLSGAIFTSHIRWNTVIIVAIFLILLLAICFIPFPYSNGESILQHIFFININHCSKLTCPLHTLRILLR